jgi:hypothetical protein
MDADLFALFFFLPCVDGVYRQEPTGAGRLAADWIPHPIRWDNEVQLQSG